MKYVCMNTHIHTHMHLRSIMSGVQDKLWSGLKEVVDGIMTSTTAVWHLQRVVAKKKVRLMSFWVCGAQW